MPYKDPQVRAQYMREYNQKRRVTRPELARNKARIWNKENPKRQRLVAYFINVRNSYGVSLTKYLATLHQQNYKCACCRTTDWGTKRVKRPCVDHDHATGEVRGLICALCNRQLGHLGDDLKSLKLRVNQFVNYLEGRS